MTKIRTMYKCKNTKIRSVNISLPDGINTEGRVNLDDSPKVQVSRELRLTSKRFTCINIDAEFLSENEKQLFIDILFKYENVIAFNNFEMNLLRSEIESPIVIHIRSHIPLTATKYSTPLCD